MEKTLICRAVAIFTEIKRKKGHMGGVGAAKKTSPEFPAVGDDGNRQNLRGGRKPSTQKGDCHLFERWALFPLQGFAYSRRLLRQGTPEMFS